VTVRLCFGVRSERSNTLFGTWRALGGATDGTYRTRLLASDPRSGRPFTFHLSPFHLFTFHFSLIPSWHDAGVFYHEYNGAFG
jgi:hypothetical protein